MGQFSWLDCVTGEQIVDDERRDVFVLVPQEYGGGHILEKCYDGYGHFGGVDIYDLVVDWNTKYLAPVLEQKDSWNCDWLRDAYLEDFRRLAKGEPAREHVEKRVLGIALACYDNDNARLRYPIKITHDPEAVYEACGISKGDPNQGWRVWDDDDEEEY